MPVSPYQSTRLSRYNVVSPELGSGYAATRIHHASRRGGGLWPLAARAQQTGRVYRVAVIGAVSPLPAMLSAFREALQQRGWTEGKNLSIDVRWPKGSFAQEPGLISEVLQSNVDVIVAWATPSALAARRATSTIPSFDRRCPALPPHGNEGRRQVGSPGQADPQPQGSFAAAHESANGTEELCEAPLANVC